jgi:carbonic anhydrase
MTRVLIVGCIALIVSACSRDSAEPVAVEHDEPELPHEVHWGYEGHEGPEHWADLSEDFAACRDGTQQSPIDLTSAVPIENVGFERRLGEMVLTADQRATVMDIIDNGHTIQVTNNAPMSIDLDGTVYELVQYHFHAPSEHTIDGDYFPLEIHFVHKSVENELVVFGLLIEEGERALMIDPVIAALPAGPGDARHLEDLQLGMSELGELPKSYYRYHGSLTTPPCSEGVEWIVFSETRDISADQLAALESHLRNNNRPVQPLGERVLGFVLGDSSEN